jgi:hypothetical protein
LLEFNPHFRITASECLKNKLFDSMRIPKLEQNSSIQIDIVNDLTQYFDYESLENKMYNEVEAINYIKQ